MASILSSYEKAPEGHRYVYIRMYDVDRDKMQQLKEDLKKKTKVLYIVDSRENKRKFRPLGSPEFLSPIFPALPAKEGRALIHHQINEAPR